MLREGLLALALVLAASPALAQPATLPGPGSPAPAAPVVGGDDVDEHSEADGHDHGDLPAGHPTLRTPRAQPVMPDPNLPAGTISARLIDENRRPLEGVRVLLETTTQSVIEGKSQRTREAMSGADGAVRFDGVDTASTHTYRVLAERGPGRFVSPVFALSDDHGFQVMVQAFPAFSALADVELATGLLLYVVPRTEAFQFELLLEVDLRGKRAWRASQKVLELPAGAKTFTTEEGHGDAHLVANGREVRLEGTLIPGRQRLSARFDVPSPTHALLPFMQQSQKTFGFDLPPKLGRLTIAAEPPPGVSLVSPQLPAAVRDRSPNGSSVLVLAWDASAPAPLTEHVEFTIIGLPTRGPLTSLALFAALALAGVGLYTLFGSRDDPEVPQRQKKLASAVMSELVLLEKAKQRGLVGPEAHSRLKRRFLALYARLSPTPRGRRRPRS